MADLQPQYSHKSYQNSPMSRLHLSPRQNGNRNSGIPFQPIKTRSTKVKAIILLFAISLTVTLNTAVKAGDDGDYAAIDNRSSYSPVVGKTTPMVMKTKRITHRDLDLSSSAARTTLLMRVQSAVRHVCNPRGFSRSEKQDSAQCEVDATARAMPKVERSISREQGTLR